MLKNFILFSALFILCIFETSLFPNLFPSAVSPDILLIAVIIWSAKNGFENTWKRSIIAGFLLDALSLGIIGLNALSFSIVAFLTGSLTGRFFAPRNAWAALNLVSLVIIGTVVHFLIVNPLAYYASFFNFNPGAFLSLLQIKKLALEIFYNLIMLAIAYWPIAKLENFLNGREYKLATK